MVAVPHADSLGDCDSHKSARSLAVDCCPLYHSRQQSSVDTWQILGGRIQFLFLFQSCKDVISKELNDSGVFALTAQPCLGLLFPRAQHMQAREHRAKRVAHLADGLQRRSLLQEMSYPF
jgi:hypothetical protein